MNYKRQTCKIFETSQVFHAVGIHNLKIKQNDSSIKILIVDDEPDCIRILAESLGGDYTLMAATRAREALKCAYKKQPDLILLDIMMPETDGYEVLKMLKADPRTRHIPVIFITAANKTANEIRGLEMGAADYIKKPFNSDILNARVQTQLRLCREQKLVRGRLADLGKTMNERHCFGTMIGKSEQIHEIYDMVEVLANLETTVLVTGESGTGKELFADTLHCNGIRSGMPLVKLSCPALSENLLESELFGHVRGAFTGAVRNKKGRIQAAEGGTLFLDEIGDISLHVQTKLLRFLETKTYERVGDSLTLKADVRVIAATHNDLEEKVRLGSFREDLWHRLNVVNVCIPTLRARSEDIPLLTRHFVSRFAESLNRNIEGISDEVTEIFLKYHWPGNIRELRNMIERACILCSDGLILKKHLPNTPELRKEIKAKKSYAAKIKREDLVCILEKSGWSKSKAANMLGIARTTLYRYMERFGIKDP